MKRSTIWVSMLLYLALGNETRAQGQLISGNLLRADRIDAPIFDATGMPLQGPRYLAALYGAIWSPEPQQGSLEPTPPIPFETGENAGYFGPQVVVLGSVPPDTAAHVQIRAWDTRLGATYEEVRALGIGGYGESALLTTTAGGGTAIPGPPWGLESFSLRVVVPEPSAGLLLLLGVPWLIWRCGRRRGGEGSPVDRER